MFDLLVFTQYPKVYGPKRFKEEALKNSLNCKIKSYKYTDLNNLPDANFVILREPTSFKNIYELRDKILNYYLSKDTKVLNSESYLKWSILDKITQHKEFVKAGIPYIQLLKLEEAHYPYIAKNKLGSHGDSVYKITCKENLDKILEKHKLEDLLFQEFLESGFDLRVIVLGGRVLGIMKRIPKSGDFLSNFSQGGTVTRYTVNRYKDIKNIEEIATKTAKHFMLDYVGVDLMLNNNNEWVVLEVNRACQFKGFEQAIGVNVASKVVKFLQH